MVKIWLIFKILRSDRKWHAWRHKFTSKKEGCNEKWERKPTEILKLGLPNFKWSFYFILLLVASLLFRRIFMTSIMALSSALILLWFYKKQRKTKSYIIIWAGQGYGHWCYYCINIIMKSWYHYKIGYFPVYSLATTTIPT